MYKRMEPKSNKGIIIYLQAWKKLKRREYENYVIYILQYVCIICLKKRNK